MHTIHYCVLNLGGSMTPKIADLIIPILVLKEAKVGTHKIFFFISKIVYIKNL
jgi:hypothetical protein